MLLCEQAPTTFAQINQPSAFALLQTRAFLAIWGLRGYLCILLAYRLRYMVSARGLLPFESLSFRHKKRAVKSLLFVVEREGFVSRWRLGRLVCMWLLFAIANLCLCLMIVFENKFSAIICQSQQSSIATALLRSPLDCCDHSNPVVLFVSAAK